MEMMNCPELIKWFGGIFKVYRGSFWVQFGRNLIMSGALPFYTKKVKF